MESQLIRCPICGDPNVTPGEYVRSWDNSCAHACNDQPRPDDKPHWSHRIPFKCKSGCHFAVIIEQSGDGTTLYTTDFIMTWS
jgi:hypothetical protein